MRIWKAELILLYNTANEWNTYFEFELQEEEYKINPNFREWTYFKNWVSDRIPMDIVVEKHTYDGYRAVQGFDEELSQVDLEELKSQMKSEMLKHLNREKEVYLKSYSDKINCINEMS